jgi:hypothetical protein
VVKDVEIVYFHFRFKVTGNHMGCTYVRWEPPGPTNLADLEGAWNDLFSALQFIERIEEELGKSKKDVAFFTMLDALTTAALVRYARSFTTGVRERLVVSQNSSLDATEVGHHERFLTIRNKHVAHPVNRFETHAVYVGVSPDDDPVNAKATVVSTGTRSGVGLSPEDLSALKSLCHKWLEYVRELKQQEENKLLIVAQQLTAEQLFALPRGPIEPDVNPEKVRSRS